MGTWSVSISGNDEFRVIYDTFRELYADHDGKKWVYDLAEIKKNMKETFSFQISDPGLAHEFWFALAKACWDFGIDDKPVFKEVQQIIKGGSNLEIWRRLNAKEKDIQKRKVILDEFLSKLSKRNPKPFKRGKVIKVWPAFGIGDLLTFQGKKGDYYGAVVTHAYHEPRGRNVVHLLNYRSSQKPKRDDLVNALLMTHEKTSKHYPPEGKVNPVDTNLQGFSFTLKEFHKSKTSFEKIGDVSFDPYGYFKDGLKSYWDMTKYSWDILPELGALNFREKLPDKQRQARLNFYTTGTSLSDKEIASIISSFKAGKSATIISERFDPKDMFVWATIWQNKNETALYVAIKGYNKTNTYLVNNIMSRFFGQWLPTCKLELDKYYFSVEDYGEISADSIGDYKPLNVAISELEQKGNNKK